MSYYGQEDEKARNEERRKETRGVILAVCFLYTMVVGAFMLLFIK